MAFPRGGMSRTARVAAVLIAAVAVLLTGCGGSGNNKPAPAPSNPKPVTVFIERGYVPGTVQNADGTVVCDPRVLSSELVQDGTIDVDGTQVTTRWDQKTVTVTFKGKSFAEAVIVNGKFASPLTGTAQSTGFVMNFGTDWKPAAPADKVVVCGGGM